MLPAKMKKGSYIKPLRYKDCCYAKQNTKMRSKVDLMVMDTWFVFKWRYKLINLHDLLHEFLHHLTSD